MGLTLLAVASCAILSDSTATVRIASRHPARAEGDSVEQIVVDAHDEHSLEAVVAGADGVVNAIS